MSLVVPAVASAVIALVMVGRGHHARAGGLVVFVVALTIARAATHGRVDAALARGAAAIAHGIGVALLTFVFVIAFVPAWLVRTGLAPLRGRKRSAEAALGWRTAAPEIEGAGNWSFVPVRPLGRFGWLGAVGSGAVSLLGWVVMLVALDLVIGSVWVDHFHHGTGRTLMVLGTEPEHRMVDLRHGAAFRSRDTDSPAMAAYPWRFEYYRELKSVPLRYIPYQLDEPVDVIGTYLNITGGVRRSYRPAAVSGAGAPQVVFYGGSTMFGEGSRDLHTIPSEVARLAEAEGLPLVPVNRAQRGWTSWQEFHAFEQRSSRGDRPDLAVFYDGANEVATEPWVYGDQPVEYFEQDWIDRFAQSQAEIRLGWPALVSPAMGEWRSRSIGARAVTRALQVTQAVPAAPLPRTSDVSGDEVADAVARIYRRAQHLTRIVGQQHHIPTVFFWQPRQYRDGIYQEVTDRLGASVIDVSDSLDGHDDVYLPDGVHTNEAGTKPVAVAMWRSLRPQIQAWYRAHGR